MIELAKKNNPTADFSVMDSRDINKLDTTFDAIIGGFCLPYLSITETEKLVLHSYQLLNENGLIYVSFVEGKANQSGFKTGSTGDRSYFYYHDLKRLSSYVTQSGFCKLEVFKVDYPISHTSKEIHTILIARKISSEPSN